MLPVAAARLGASKVAKSGTKKAAKNASLQTKRANSRLNREISRNRIENKIWSHARHSTNDSQNGENNPTLKVNKLLNKVKAIRAYAVVVEVAFIPIVLHLAFSLVSLFGAGAEIYLQESFLGIGSYFFPGEELWAVSYILSLFFAIISLVIAAVTYVVSGVDIFSDSKPLAFGLFLILCFIPIPIPWVLLWGFWVILDQ